MCGILGQVDPRNQLPSEEQFLSLLKLLDHRGPDGFGAKKHNNCIFGHSRLSILDLSDAGSQPMESKCGRYLITFNGEIYNHQEIRDDLSKSFKLQRDHWVGSSDTETLLSSISLLGLESTMKIVRGMFAFGLWDKFEKSISLVRDPIGEKPLYYNIQDGSLIFSSELKPIKKILGSSLNISKDVLTLYFKYNYIPTPYSIYENTFKLNPGSILRISLDALNDSKRMNMNFEYVNKNFELCEYWSLEKCANDANKNKFSTYDESLFEVNKALNLSVQRQQISDVPLGCFLSGGIDSSLIASIMSDQCEYKINTFTIGFHEKEFDESIYAKRIADFIDSNHHQRVISINDAIDIIPQIPKIYDEPFADSSQIPTYLVSKIARENVTVCLSGDGGDEFFGGYNRHFKVVPLSKLIHRIPRSLRPILSSFIRSLSQSNLKIITYLFNKIFQSSSNMNDKLFRLSRRIAESKTNKDLYRSFLVEWDDNENLLSGLNEPAHFLNQQWMNFENFEETMMYVDAKTYLPDDILVKVDRASMANSLETRAPFLDIDLINTSFKVPLEHKISSSSGKKVLKDLLHKKIPRDLFDRQKQGFGVPVADWLRGPLKDDFEAMISKSSIQQYDFIDYDLINKKWNQHLNKSHNWAPSLWSIYMLQLWSENNL